MLKQIPEKANSITYIMVCPEGNYVAESWIKLGWAIFSHRLWHLWKHKRWMD